MNITALLAEINNDPLWRHYNSMTDAQVAQSLNTADRPDTYSRRVNEQDILDEFPDPDEAEAFLQKLETVAETDALISRSLDWLKPGEEGIDLGHPIVQAMFGSLVGTAEITEEEIRIVTGMAKRTISRARELKLGHISARHIQRARRQ